MLIGNTRNVILSKDPIMYKEEKHILEENKTQEKTKIDIKLFKITKEVCISQYNYTYQILYISWYITK